MNYLMNGPEVFLVPEQAWSASRDPLGQRMCISFKPDEDGGCPTCFSDGQHHCLPPSNRWFSVKIYPDPHIHVGLRKMLCCAVVEKGEPCALS